MAAALVHRARLAEGVPLCRVGKALRLGYQPVAFWSRKVFASMAYGIRVRGPYTFTSMNWLFGSGDRVAGTSSHIVRLLTQDSWTRFEPAIALQEIFTLFGSSPMHRPEPTLAIRYSGIEPPRYWPR